MEGYKNAITEMTILRNSLIKLSDEFDSIDLGCIGAGQVSLYLGDNWFVSVQKPEALEIIDRRIKFLDSQISNLQIAALKSELSEFVDIVEQEDVSPDYIMPSNNEFCRKEKQVGDFEENLFKLIKDLEHQELSETIHDNDSSSDGSICSESESISEESQVSIASIKKKVHFAPDIDDSVSHSEHTSETLKTPVKDLIVEREIESFDDDSDIEDYHIGREISREYIAFRDKIEVSTQNLKNKGRGLDKFQPKVSEFKKRSLVSKEI